ncbi:MAG: toll/interleukin-1 receptor domain-containing protein [Chitinophagaceae bacterium]|nr:toll/interleukin-1 receptor domain-containing protein [Chitinophagaceae bacterium]
MANFFISYSRKNTDIAKRIRNLISRLDTAHDVFLDTESIKAGADWKKELENRIKKCDHFIYIHSPESLQSKYIKQELAWVRQSELKTGIRKLIVYRLQFADIIPQLAAYQILDATDDFTIDFFKLMSGILQNNSFYTVEHEIQLADEWWYSGKFWIDAPPEFLKKIQMVEYRFDYGWDTDAIETVKASPTSLKNKFKKNFETKYHFTVFVVIYLLNTKELYFVKTIPVFH